MSHGPKESKERYGGATYQLTQTNFRAIHFCPHAHLENWKDLCLSMVSMAAIEALLKILTARNAKSLSIEPGVAPTLDKDGGSEQLSMPPLGQEMVNLFTSEIFFGRDTTFIHVQNH